MGEAGQSQNRNNKNINTSPHHKTPSHARCHVFPRIQVNQFHETQPNATTHNKSQHNTHPIPSTATTHHPPPLPPIPHNPFLPTYLLAAREVVAQDAHKLLKEDEKSALLLRARFNQGRLHAVEYESAI